MALSDKIEMALRTQKAKHGVNLMRPSNKSEGGQKLEFATCHVGCDDLHGITTITLPGCY